MTIHIDTVGNGTSFHEAVGVTGVVLISIYDFVILAFGKNF